MAEFAKVAAELKRMCKSAHTCKECPMWDETIHSNCLFPRDPNVAEHIIIKWAEEHPVETRLTKFAKAFPNYARLRDNVPEICAKCVYGREVIKCCRDCEECWNTPISDAGSGERHDT